MSHRGEGKAVLVISQFSHNLSVSLSNHYSAKNPKLTQVEHTCSLTWVHMRTSFPSDPAPFDNKLVLLIGDEDSNIIGLTIPNNKFTVSPVTNFIDVNIHIYYT